MSFSIAGKTAIVTGAANGLGLAIARHFVDRGANVVFADSDEARLEAEVGEEARAEGQIRMFAGDLSQKLSVSNLISTTVDAFDRIDILVNGARRFFMSDTLNAEADHVDDLWQQNVMSALRVSQLVARKMLIMAEKSGTAPGEMIGSIINISSIAAVRAQPQLIGFSMASAAVEQMTRSLAVDLAPKGIRVNAVAIGSVLSASLQEILRDKPEWRAQLEQGTPLGRVAAPDELVETLQYLASDSSRFVTGQVLTVDGGRGLLDAVHRPAF